MGWSLSGSGPGALTLAEPRPYLPITIDGGGFDGALQPLRLWASTSNVYGLPPCSR